MMSDFDDRIFTWLESVTANQTTDRQALTGSTEVRQTTDKQSRGILTKKRTWVDADGPLSPPPSQQEPLDHARMAHNDRGDEPAETPKRRRLGRENAADDTTPRPWTGARRTAPSLGDEASSLSYEGSVSSASHHSSPSKEISALGLYPDGVETKSMDVTDPDMPVSLAQLFLEMETISRGRAVVPRHFQQEISSAQETDLSFALFDATVFAPIDDFSDDLRDISLDKIVQITGDAKDCYDTEIDEAGWNSLVHMPLLQAVFYGRRPRGRQLDGFCPCTTAKILAPYRVKNIHGKQVDYVFHLDPTKDREQPDAGEAVKALRLNLPSGSINHTDFAPLRPRPISVSIETKRSGEGEQKAKLQMGVWQAAQWKLLRDLAGDGVGELPFIPGIVIHGHMWRFVATTYANGKTTHWTGGMFGSTEAALKTFQAIAGVRRLRKWAVQVFWPWYKAHALESALSAG